MQSIKQWRTLLASVGLLSISFCSLADSLDAQRIRYQQAKQAWESKQIETAANLHATLVDYPLYPYLEYRRLTQDLSQLSVNEASQFVTRYPTLPSTKTLINSFIHELALRQDWKSLLSFSPKVPTSAAARCDYHYAQWATGQKPAALSGANTLWMTGKSLPASCDKLFTVWQQAGQQTAPVILARIKLAFEEKNAALINQLSKKLPAEHASLGSALLALQNNPATVSHFAKTIGPTDFSREITLLAFTEFAKKNADQALLLIHDLVIAQKMNRTQQASLEESVAWRWMGNDASAEQAAWRDSITTHSQNSALLERRVRMAIGEGNKTELLKWFSLLPAETKSKDEWVYWQAMLLIDGPRKSEAETQLRNLMKKRGFYPMAAAQKLKTNYNITINRATRPESALTQRPEIARIRELLYWDLESLARSEWINLLEQSSPSQQEALARYAFEQRWADLSVQATISAKLWDHLEERFPLVWESYFTQMTQNKGISASYAMAIARQESAWNPQAESPAGARGLMQLMPQTAVQTAKKAGLSGYTSSDQLFDPKINIALGAHYLDQVFQSFDNNRIFAAAAYNAGPNRVSRWLSNSAGRIDAIAFIESIPFAETRSYVKNVLVYDVFYRYFMKQQLKLLTDAEWENRY